MMSTHQKLSITWLSSSPEVLVFDSQLGSVHLQESVTGVTSGVQMKL